MELVANDAANNASEPPTEMKRFGRYTLVGKLGHGGMAQVHLAVTQGMGDFRKVVVLKILHSHLETDPAFVDMFMDEARLAARLSHPHVVSTFEVGEFQGAHFMAMQYLEGQPLDRVLDRMHELKGGIDLTAAVTILGHVLQGLHYAHELRDYDGTPLGVVHRDVSPHNVFITYHGLAKILDFGIAKAATKASHTRTGVIRGKYAYMAPEQAEGRDVDARADVWSAGVVAWEVLTGKRLFRRDNEMATLHALTQLEIPKISDVNSAVPEAIADVVAGALTRSAETRYRSADDFRNALQEAAAAHGIQPSSELVASTLREAFAKEEKKGRNLVGQAMQAELADDLPEFRRGWVRSPKGATPVTATAQGFHFLSGAPDPRPRSGRRLPIVAGLLLAAVLGAAVAAWVVRPAVQTLEPQSNGMSTTETGTTGSHEQGRDLTGAVHPETVPPNPTVEAPEGHGEVSVAPAVVGEPAAQETTPPGGRSRNSQRSRNRRRGRGTMVSSMARAAEPAQAGRLSFDTTPWTNVTLAGRSLGQTPLLGVEVPAGNHILRLRNPELGISRTYSVTVRPGEATRLRIALD